MAGFEIFRNPGAVMGFNGHLYVYYDTLFLLLKSRNKFIYFKF
jgi:hypothetical protein